MSTPKEIPGSQEIRLHSSADLSEDRGSGFEALFFPQSAVNMSHGNKYSLGQLTSLGLLHKL